VPEIYFKGRRAVTVENEHLRVTVLVEGGHIAEVFDKRAGVSPLWVPHWNSVEPSLYSPVKHSEVVGWNHGSQSLSGSVWRTFC
jgi:hypothetical protein